MLATNAMRACGRLRSPAFTDTVPSSGSASLRATALLGQVSTRVFRLVRHLAMTVQSHGGSSTLTFGTESSISAIRTSFIRIQKGVEAVLQFPRDQPPSPSSWRTLPEEIGHSGSSPYHNIVMESPLQSQRAPSSS